MSRLQIGDTGCLALAAALKGALCLQRLNLNHNRFSSQTLAAIADALRVNTSEDPAAAAAMKDLVFSNHCMIQGIPSVPVPSCEELAACMI
jgi:hypothetical protein